MRTSQYIFIFLRQRDPDYSYILSDGVQVVVIIISNNVEHHRPTTVCFIHFWYWSPTDTVERDNNMDKSQDNQPGMLTGCPEATTTATTQITTSKSHLSTALLMHTESPATTSVHEVSALTTGIRKEGILAPAARERTLLSASALPTNESLTKNPLQVSNSPAPPKGKVTTPTINEDVIPQSTVVREEDEPAIGKGSLLSASVLPTYASLAGSPLQVTTGPTPKKQKVAAPAIISDSISNK